MIEPQVIQLTSEDGHRAELIAIIPENPTHSLLWMSAMGVAARNYLPLAQLLAKQGVAVFLHEWRGIGSSSWRASRRCNWNYHHLLELDIVQSDAARRERLPGIPLLLGGHSLGGQIGSCYAGMNPSSCTAGLWLVCTGSPYFKTFAYLTSAGVLASYILLPAISQIAGKLPGKRLNFAGNEARGVIREWARTALTGEYAPISIGVNLDQEMAKVETQITGVTMSKDWLAPDTSLAFLQAKFKRSESTLRSFSEADVPYSPDHFTWMKDPAAIVEHLIQSIRSG